jgi:hypothetical protein
MGLAVGEITREVIQERWGCQPEKLSQAHGKFYTRAKNPWSARAMWRNDTLSFSCAIAEVLFQNTKGESIEEE